MDTQKLFSYFINSLKENLSNHKQNLKNDLIQLFNGNLIQFIEGKSFEDVAVFHFEFASDTLNIVFWCEDENENVLTKAGLRIGKIENDDNFPKKLRAELYDLEEEQIEIDENLFYEFSDDLSSETYKIIEEWFIENWNETKHLKPNNIKAFFSIHDTIHKTKLT